jgi:tetratricopeptide (TPR) repeat protein
LAVIIGVIATFWQARVAQARRAKAEKRFSDVRNLAIYETERARAQIELGRFRDAAPVLERVLEIMIPIADANDEPTYRYDVAIAHRFAAKAYFKLGNKAKAAGSIEKAIAIIQQLKSIDSLRDADKDLPAELEAERAEYAGDAR